MYKESISIADNVILPKSFVTDVDFFVGIRKYGKSYGSGVLQEEFIEANYPMYVIDPMGIHAGLRQKYTNILIMGGQYGDLSLDIDIIKELISSDISIIFDLSELSTIQQAEYAAEIFQEIKEHNQKPVKIFIEECDIFIPQRGGNKQCKELITWLVRKGRQHGIGVTFICQRFTSVDKEVLTQVDNYFIFKITYPNDTTFLKRFIDKDIVKEIATFTPGDCYMHGIHHTGRMRFKKRVAEHLGYTPTLGEEAPTISILEPNNEISKITSHYLSLGRLIPNLLKACIRI